MNVYTKLMNSLALCLLCLSHCMQIVPVSFTESEGKAADGNAPSQQLRTTEPSQAEKAFENEQTLKNKNGVDSQNKNEQAKQTSLSTKVTTIDVNNQTVITETSGKGIDLTSVTQDATVEINTSRSSEPLFSDSASLKSESLDSVDSSDGFDLFSDTSMKSTESTKSTMQKPDDSVAQVMQKSLPQGQKMMTMGRREDGSHYMISAKVEEVSKESSHGSSKKPKIKTLHILEFDEHGQPIKDSKGQVKTTSLDIQSYRDQLSSSRDVLLQKAQQELAEFKNPEKLQKQTEAYKKQQDAYNKAIATRDNLEMMVRTDPSVQDAYQQAERNLDILRQENFLEDPADIMKRMENTVVKYSDKTTRVSAAKKNLDEARQTAIDTNNKITTLQKEYDNEKDPVKRSQIGNELQGAKNSKVFIDQDVTRLTENVTRTQNSSDMVEQGDFKSIFDDITSEFVNDADIMDSLKDNKDYQDYKEQVTKKIYKPTMVESTMSGINSLATFMADADLGKAFKVKTPNPSKFFKSLAQDAKYAFKNVKEKINKS